MLEKSEIEIENQPFRYIMERNINMSHQLYKETLSKKLFYALLKDFTKHAILQKHKPIFILLPQLIDFNIINKTGLNLYSDFIENIDIPKSQVIDFTRFF